MLTNMLETIGALIAGLSDFILEKCLWIKKMVRRYKNKAIRQFKLHPVDTIVTTVSIIFLLWVLISFIDVNLTNIPGGYNYGAHMNHKWNIFVRLGEYIEKYYK